MRLSRVPYRAPAVRHGVRLRKNAGRVVGSAETEELSLLQRSGERVPVYLSSGVIDFGRSRPSMRNALLLLPCPGSIEIAPAPGFPSGLRERVTAAAVTLAKSVRYQNAGTVEFH